MSSVTPLDRPPLRVAPTGHESAGHDWEQAQRDHPVPSARFRWLGWFNWLIAALIFPPILPVIGILVVVTRLTSRGPALFRQMRVGLRGKTFWVYKIRTMSQDAEALTGPVWSPGMADPRITKFGRFLRKSHLDELPQLFNVLAGDMVLIGPRPERPEFTQFLAQEIPGYVGRLSVKPGITGMAQINLPPDTDLESVRRKLELDLDYISNSNIWIDIRILVCTALKVFGMPGHKLAKWFGLRRRPTGEPRDQQVERRSTARSLQDQHEPQEDVDKSLDQARVDTAAAPLNLRPVSLQSALNRVSGNGDGSVLSRLNGTRNHRVTSKSNGNGHPGLPTGLSDETIVASADDDTHIA
jgi:lipopolysaccharide/colanic/teichoic acid biosynthesis glycosyltransferase